MKLTQKDPKQILRTIHLTNLLLEDIRTRKLQPGTPYYTTQEASQFLNVAAIFANQALQLLEKRRVIKMCQRTGSVINELPNVPSKEEISHVVLVVNEQYFRLEGDGSGDVLSGLQMELSSANIDIGLLNRNNEEEHVMRIINEALSNNDVDAFVLISVSFSIQKIFEKSCFPTVIFGSPFPSITGIPCIERDMTEGFEQILWYLQKRHRKHFVYLFRNTIHPGDKIIPNVLCSQPKQSADTVILFTTSFEEEIKAAVRNIFLSEFVPDAFICTSILQAEVVEEVMYEQGLIPYQDMDIIVTSYFFQRGIRAKYTHLSYGITPEEIGRKIGQMLRLQTQEQNVSNDMIPVELVPCRRDSAANIF